MLNKNRSIYLRCNNLEHTTRGVHKNIVLWQVVVFYRHSQNPADARARNVSDNYLENSIICGYLF